MKVKLLGILVYAFGGLKSETMVTALLVRKVMKTLSILGLFLLASIS